MKKLDKKSVFIFLLFLLLLTDWSYSFLQYYHQPLQGDLVPVVLPEPQFEKVLSHPFGLEAIQTNEKYGGVNRYFVHKTLYESFRAVPLWLQTFMTPINSLYATAALFKWSFHLALVLLLTCYIQPKVRFWSLSFLGTALFVSPFFQANGYSHVIGIVDRSVVYAFSYALPVLLLLLYFLPFYRYATQSARTKVFRHPIQSIFWLFLMLWLSFSGPLVAPLVLLICPSVLLIYGWYFYRKNQNLYQAIRCIPKVFLGYFSIFILLNLYSFYLGSYNIENDQFLSLAERYARLPIGCYKLLVRKLALPLMLLLLLVNFTLLQRKLKIYWQTTSGKTSFICLIFIGLYLLLLPLGGYRIYRPYVLRYDTLMPVTLVLLFLIGRSSFQLLSILKVASLRYYSTFLGIVLFLFTFADSPKWSKNDCERKALQSIQQSEKAVMVLEENCPVLEWIIFEEAQQSRYVAEMLVYWKVIDREVLFYSK